MAPPIALPVVLRIARRDLRGGARSFVVFFLCLMVGVGAIAAVRSVADSATAGMQADARTLLGGDVEIRLIHRTAGAEQLAFLARSGAVSRVAEMRAMARTESAKARMLIELKAVDGKYPLAGAMALDPAMALEDALAPRGGVYGAAVEKGVLTRLGVRLGDRLRIGDADIQIRALINREPDRGTDIFSLGPRVMVALDALPATNLVQPGSLVNYRYRVALNKGTESASWITSLDARFPDAGWRVVDLHNVAPGLERLLDRVSLYLTLVGLTALLIGGVGVASAVKTYLDGRRTTIAVLKCVGATGGLVFRIYLAQVMIVALVATLAGLLLGAVAPLALAAVLGESLPLRLPFALYPGALGLAGAFGLVTALAFSLWPLAMARETSPAGLFRSLIVPGPARVRARDAAMIGLCALLLAGLVIWPAADRRIAAWFVIGAALILALLVMAARMLA
ncbi:MAG: FtsX-like permease family protein, partial [Alphaproteobacteria bacterium]